METETLLSPVAPAPSRDLPALVLRQTSGWAAINFAELWHYRDLLLILIERDVKLRYKQTALGILWVIIQPLIAAGIFTVIFGLFAKLPSGGMPYLLFNFAGLAAWNYFAGALQRASGSLVSNAQLISKVYFPRLIIPLAQALAVLLDFAVMFILLLVLMACYHVWPTWRLATLPLFLLLGTVGATGVSLWLSALSVKYRDFTYALPFLIQVWMYATPIIYATSMIPARWQDIHRLSPGALAAFSPAALALLSPRTLYALNPLVGFIEGFRWCTLGQSDLGAGMLVSSAVISLLLFVGGALFFRRTERTFADVI